MTFLLFILGIALVATLFYLVVALARLREKDRIIGDLSRKMFEARKSGKSRSWRVGNPASAGSRRSRLGEVVNQRDELEARVEEITEHLEKSRELIERFEKGLWPRQFRESGESRALHDKLQETLLQEEPQRGASGLLGKIHEICSEDGDLKRDTAAKSGTAIYDWLNQLKVTKRKKEELVLSYKNWLNKQIEPLGIYSIIVHEGDPFTEDLHDANGHGSHVRRVHSLAFYRKNGEVYKKARVTI